MRGDTRSAQPSSLVGQTGSGFSRSPISKRRVISTSTVRHTLCANGILKGSLPMNRRLVAPFAAFLLSSATAIACAQATEDDTEEAGDRLTGDEKSSSSRGGSKSSKSKGSSSSGGSSSSVVRAPLRAAPPPLRDTAAAPAPATSVMAASADRERRLASLMTRF